MTSHIVRLAGITRIAVRERMQYRFDFFMTLVSTLLFSSLFYMVWRAIYDSSSGDMMPWSQLITYIMMAQAVNFARWSPADRAPVYEQASRIRSGDLALDLIRPIGFQTRRFMEAAGFFTVEMLWVNLPCILMFIFVLGIQPPPSIGAALGYGLSLTIAFVVSYALNSIIMMISFWTTNAQGLQIAKKAIVGLLAGTIIPFELFPEGVRMVVSHLPFQSLAHIPLSIYTGKIVGIDTAAALGEQLLWALLMLGISQWIWATASRRITIYGG